jgi:hypothetical protein
LIKSEEEKLKVSKALVELQIENTKLQEIIQNEKFDNNSKLLHAENDVLESNIKEERAAQAIQDLQDKLRESLDEKKELEIEFVALKKNFINLQSDIDSEKAKNDNLGLELINLVNENKALQDDSNRVNLKHTDVSDEHQRLIRKLEKLETELYDKREAFVVAQGEIQRLKNEITRLEVAGQQNSAVYEQRKAELEREYIEASKRNLQEMDVIKTEDKNYHKKNVLEKELWDGERIDYQKKIKQLNRKIEELTDDLKILEEQNIELKSDKNRLTLQVEEMRSAFRNKLTKYMNENNPDSSAVTWKAKEELIRSYTEKEVDLSQRLERESKRIDEKYKQLRALKNYARSLKYLAEDWAPVGQPLPEVLTLPPPVTLDDEDDNEFVRQQQSEIDRLKMKNRNLEEDMRNANNSSTMHKYSTPKSKDGDMQSKILKELEYLKGNPDVLKKPGTASIEVEKLRKERDNLYKENLKLQNFIGQESAGPQSGNAKYMKTKIFHLEKELSKLERERSELLGRTTNAETQLTALQEHLSTSTHSYQKKIFELKKILKSKGIDVSGI